jgi:hypothetical protein
MGSLSTGWLSYSTYMGFEIFFSDNHREDIEADGYALEGPLTTFFCTDPGRTPRLDPWATRILSVRTDSIAVIRRATEAPGLSLVG